MKLNGNLHGFEFIRSREIPELRGVLHEAVYKKNGAKLLFIDREDSNKTFAIAFKTIPEDHTGVFHILEHSVLCGSDKYPVKEPFVELLKGSLKTFLNAFTFPDKTMYPVSSRNDKDFLNLVDIYMDAVLHPLAITKPEIFYQEGWHHELHSKDEDMIYKGVVFNEMKGAYSSADEVEMSELSALLYDSTCYAKDSGGKPSDIPTLTYESFVNAHAKYYHPSNSRIILDGSVDLDETLALLDSFLKEYDYLEVDAPIPPLVHKGHSEKTIEYEISPSEDPEGKARVCLGFATTTFEEKKLSTALTIATNTIAGTNASPFKKAMLDSGLCEDVCFIPYDGIRDEAIAIEIKNVKVENLEKAKSLALETIANIVKEGIDKNALTASFNSLEFTVREQESPGTPLGITYAIAALDTWLYDGDPMDTLAFEDEFAYLREKLDTDFYEKLLEKYILNSTHSATLYMLPSAELGEKREEAEREKLTLAKASMTDEELDSIIKTTESLESWQQTPDTTEALATIPMLSVSDIKELPDKYEWEEREVDGVRSVFTEANSRGIDYTTLLFDISDFNETEIFGASLLSDLYKKIETDSYSVVDLQTKIKRDLGAFNTSIQVCTKDGVVTPYFKVHAKSLVSKMDSVVEVAAEVLLASKFDDAEAIGRIIRQKTIAAQEIISEAGHAVAISRAGAYENVEAAVNEYVSGIERYLRLKALDDSYFTYKNELSAFLYDLVKRIFTKKRLSVYYCGEKVEGYDERLVSIFKDGEDFERGSKIKPLGVRREGILIPAAVSFAAMSGDVSSYENFRHGSHAVARSIISFEYLWNVIRVQGGAYGTGFSVHPNGTMGFYTYRDPNADRSVEMFKRTPEFLREFANNTESLDNFIIGTIGNMDPIETPALIGMIVLVMNLRGRTYEAEAKERYEVLHTTKEDILRAADLIEKLVANAGVCIVGGKAQLDGAMDKIDTVIEI